MPPVEMHLVDMYQPVFCHNCGINLNPIEDYDDPPDADTATCGWCGQVHSYAKIKECRYLAGMSTQALAAGVVPGLLALRERLER